MRNVAGETAAVGADCIVMPAGRILRRDVKLPNYKNDIGGREVVG